MTRQVCRAKAALTPGSPRIIPKNPPADAASLDLIVPPPPPIVLAERLDNGAFGLEPDDFAVFRAFHPGRRLGPGDGARSRPCWGGVPFGISQGQKKPHPGNGSREPPRVDVVRTTKKRHLAPFVGGPSVAETFWPLFDIFRVRVGAGRCAMVGPKRLVVQRIRDRAVSAGVPFSGRECGQPAQVGPGGPGKVGSCRRVENGMRPQTYGTPTNVDVVKTVRVDRVLLAGPWRGPTRKSIKTTGWAQSGVVVRARWLAPGCPHQVYGIGQQAGE